jgi:alpha-tubulin suppressor-like RCC1 family protein
LNIGDNEIPAVAGDVSVGNTVAKISAGNDHTCAAFEDQTMRCWGGSSLGQLGYGNALDIGDNELPSAVGTVNVGGGVFVSNVSASSAHTCILSNGSTKCWGDGSFGVLGQGSTSSIGDNETPSAVGFIDVGGLVSQISSGEVHTCALLVTGKVRCWGIGFATGYGNGLDVGDDEFPSAAGDLDLGGDAIQISVGQVHTCAVLTTGRVRCWGGGELGKLGYGNQETIGDDETPASVGDVPIF